MTNLLRGCFAALAFLLSPALIYAQCPLCYRAAASAGERFIQALRLGILILLPAPFLLGGLIAYMAYQKRDHYMESPEPLSPADSPLD